MKLFHKLLPAVVLGFAVTACDDTLVVENLISPDVDRVFATPASIEATIASGFQGCHNGHTGTTDLNAQLLVLALESYSQLNNFFMGPRGGIPRSPVVNFRGTDGAHFGPFSRFSRGGRLAVNAVNALDVLTAPPPGNNGTLGTAAQNIRARSFGFFIVGCNQGFLALSYDSAGIVNPGMSSDVVPPLSGAQDVMVNALNMLDSAENIALSGAAAATGGFPLPDTWFSGNTHSSRAAYIQVIRSFKARFRAGVARTPVQRAAVNWEQVITDANAGVTADFGVNTGASTGWSISFIGSQMHVEPGWSQLSLMYMGMADQQGGCYDTQYINLPRDSRNPDCVIITADQRWPAGATRAAQRTNSPQPTSFTSRPYVSNRSIQDAPGDPWGYSQYDYFRYKYIRNNNSAGLWPEFMKAEGDLLAAEGYLRRNNGVPGAADVALAAAKIDLSRVARGGLPPLTGVVTARGVAVPGGAVCVPRVPDVAPYTSTRCGDIWEAMKWEYRMETAYSGFGQWFFAGRGWNDLVENSPLEYPVPFQELDALQKGYYGLGGGGVSSAARGTYGF